MKPEHLKITPEEIDIYIRHHGDVLMMKCEEHGVQPWKNHIICSNCSRIYEMENAPHTCACGVMLLPLLDSHNDFSARMICEKCFNERLELEP